MPEIKSDLIKDIEYVPATNELTVRFHGGIWFKFKKIPEAIYQGFASSSDPDQYFHDHIKGYRHKSTTNLKSSEIPPWLSLDYYDDMDDPIQLRALWAAVIDRADEDMRGNASGYDYGVAKRQYRTDAMNYVNSDDARVFGYNDICDLLELDSGRLRNKLIKEAEEAKAKHPERFYPRYYNPGPDDVINGVVLSARW